MLQRGQFFSGTEKLNLENRQVFSVSLYYTIQAYNLLSASTAKSQLAAMLNNGNLREIFGSEIAGIPTETVLAITQAQVWGGGAIF